MASFEVFISVYLYGLFVCFFIFILGLIVVSGFYNISISIFFIFYIPLYDILLYLPV